MNGTAQTSIGPQGMFDRQRSKDESLAFLDCGPHVHEFEMIFLSPVPKPLQPYLNFVRPYSFTVWLSLLVCVLVSSLVIYGLKIALDIDSDKSHLFLECLFEISGSFLSQSKYH